MSIREVALAKKGTFATVAYSRPVKTVKTCPVQIMKTTVARNVRIGVQYDAIKSVQIAKGVSNTKEAHTVNEGLRGFEWDVYPTLLKSVKTGDKYVRIATNSNTRFDTTYTVDGKEVNKSDIEQYLYSSEKSHNGDLPAVLNINLNTISYIH